MEDSLVSIIVPIYNVEQYIDICVQSLTMQTYEAIEIILIDDGSTDGSAQKCFSWKEKDTRIIFFHQENKGVSEARNKGIELATGRWFAFVDPDDYVERTYIEYMFGATRQKEKVDLVICDHYSEGGGKRQRIAGFDNEQTFTARDREYLISRVVGLDEKRQGGGQLFGAVWGKLYRAEIIKNKIRFDAELPRAQNTIFNIEFIGQMRRGEYISVPLYHYVYRDESESNRFSPRQHLIAHEILIRLKCILQENISREQAEKLVSWRAIGYIMESIKLELVNEKCELDIREKTQRIKEICEMEIFNKAIRNVNTQYFDWKGKMFCILLKCRMYYGAYLLGWLRYGRCD